MREIKNKNMKWWIGIVSCLMLFAVITIFGYEKMSFVWSGVKIEASLEKVAGTSLATIKGVALHATVLSLNGREIFIDKNGNFSETIAILPGYSIITLDAKDKFGKTAEKKFELVTEENAPAIAFSNSEIIN